MNYGIIARQAIKKAKKLTHCPEKTEVGMIFVGDKKMRSLNRKYRGKDKATNVLSFGNAPHPALSRWERALRPRSERVRDLGDIFISVPFAKREAKKYGWALEYEISRLAAHGFLHLIGYDHKNKKEAGRMERIEEMVLEELT